MPITRDSSGQALLGSVRLADLVRDPGIGTPFYVYDLDAMAAEAGRLERAFEGAPHLVAYAVKANSAGAIVRTLARAGCGADVVSGAELRLVLACGIAPERIVYSGVAKTDEELAFAVSSGDRGIGAIQIESVEEVERVDVAARRLGRTVRVSIRMNPSIELETMGTHAHIATGHDEAKFGVPPEDVRRAIDAIDAAEHLELVGMGMHVGSQVPSIAPYVEAARSLFSTVRELRGAGRLPSLAYVDTGGGFGIDYGSGCPVTPPDFVRAAREEQNRAGLGDLALYIEPGRSLVAAHGVLVARVIQSKVASARRWIMIDAGMNDLMRPALYQARHRIVPLDRDVDRARALEWRVVGPVCESSDDFGGHLLAVDPPEAVAILDTGAYGYTMASQYNGRQLPVEVFVGGGRVVGKTRRASADDWAGERARAGSS
jgi:diaminopimelate decarboxylase